MNPFDSASMPVVCALTPERLRLTSPSGLTVNAWLIPSSDGPVLVDAGFTYTVDSLRQQLDQRGIALMDLAAVLYTHTHEDHMGGGVVLDAELRGRHVVASGTLPAQGNYFDWYDALEPWDAWLARTLPEGGLRDVMLDARARRHRQPWRTGGDGYLRDVQWVLPQGTFAVGDLNFERIDTPGHDPWHVAWREQRTGLLFVGDTLLGLPTPIMEPLLDDLTPYRESLRRLSRLSDVSLVLPGHGRAWTSLADAVSMSWSHVERVAAAVRSALLLGPTDIGEVAASLLDPERPDLKRAFIWISNVHAQLAEWQRMGLCAVRDDRRWVQTGALPEVEHLS